MARTYLGFFPFEPRGWFRTRSQQGQCNSKTQGYSLPSMLVGPVHQSHARRPAPASRPGRGYDLSCERRPRRSGGGGMHNVRTRPCFFSLQCPRGWGAGPKARTPRQQYKRMSGHSRRQITKPRTPEGINGLQPLPGRHLTRDLPNEKSARMSSARAHLSASMAIAPGRTTLSGSWIYGRPGRIYLANLRCHSVLT
jgi:hypothetical protein